MELEGTQPGNWCRVVLLQSVEVIESHFPEVSSSQW